MTTSSVRRVIRAEHLGLAYMVLHAYGQDTQKKTKCHVLPRRGDNAVSTRCSSVVAEFRPVL
jgi:hypothetical protein